MTIISFCSSRLSDSFDHRIRSEYLIDIVASDMAEELWNCNYLKGGEPHD